MIGPIASILIFSWIILQPRIVTNNDGIFLFWDTLRDEKFINLWRYNH